MENIPKKSHGINSLFFKFFALNFLWGHQRDVASHIHVTRDTLTIYLAAAAEMNSFFSWERAKLRPSSILALI